MATKKPSKDITTQVEAPETPPTVATEPEPIPMTPPTVEPIVELPQAPVTISDVIELQRQLEAKRGQAIKQLLQEIDERRAQLRILGFEEEGAVATRPARAPRKQSAPSQAPEGGSSSGKAPYCKYCDATGHDARAHRGQAVKRRFTPAELAALK
jgi:hypothetical protein